MKRIILLISFALGTSLPFYGQVTDLPAIFISIDGNYDYEMLYYSREGNISSFTNLCYDHPALNKGDSILITTEIRMIEIPGDNSWSESEVVREIKLTGKGKLSRILETAPPMQYIYMEQLPAAYRELIPREMPLFIMSTDDEYMRDVLSRDDKGTIVVKLYGHSLMPDESWEDIPAPPKLSGEIRCRTDEAGEEFIMYFGITPDYDETVFYHHLRENKFIPVHFDF